MQVRKVPLSTVLSLLPVGVSTWSMRRVGRPCSSPLSERHDGLALYSYADGRRAGKGRAPRTRVRVVEEVVPVEREALHRVCRAKERFGRNTTSRCVSFPPSLVG